MAYYLRVDQHLYTRILCNLAAQKRFDSGRAALGGLCWYADGNDNIDLGPVIVSYGSQEKRVVITRKF